MKRSGSGLARADFMITAAMAPWVLLLIIRLVKRVSMVRLVMLAVAVGAVLLGGSPQDFLFLFLLCLFIRYLPMISIFEMRTLLPGAQAHADGAEEHA